MENIMLQTFEWNLHMPTFIETLLVVLSQGIIFVTDKVSKDELIAVQQKSRKLCQYIANLVVYDARISIERSPQEIVAAIIMEARRKSLNLGRQSVNQSFCVNDFQRPSTLASSVMTSKVDELEICESQLWPIELDLIFSSVLDKPAFFETWKEL